MGVSVVLLSFILGLVSSISSVPARAAEGDASAHPYPPVSFGEFELLDTGAAYDSERLHGRRLRIDPTLKLTITPVQLAPVPAESGPTPEPTPPPPNTEAPFTFPDIAGELRQFVHQQRMNAHQERDKLAGQPERIERDTTNAIAGLRDQLTNIDTDLILRPPKDLPKTVGPGVTSVQLIQARADATLNQALTLVNSTMTPARVTDLAVAAAAHTFKLRTEEELNQLDAPALAIVMGNLVATNRAGFGFGGPIVAPKDDKGFGLSYTGSTTRWGYELNPAAAAGVSGRYGFDKNKALQLDLGVAGLDQGFKPHLEAGASGNYGKLAVGTRVFHDVGSSIFKPGDGSHKNGVGVNVTHGKTGGNLSLSEGRPDPKHDLREALLLLNHGGLAGNYHFLNVRGDEGLIQRNEGGLSDSWALEDSKTKFSAGISAAHIIDTTKPKVVDDKSATLRVGLSGETVDRRYQISAGTSGTVIVGCALPSADLSVQFVDTWSQLRAILSASYDSRTGDGLADMRLSGPLNPFERHDDDQREADRLSNALKETLDQLIPLQTRYLALPREETSGTVSADVHRLRYTIGLLRVSLKSIVDRLEESPYGFKYVSKEDVEAARAQGNAEKFGADGKIGMPELPGSAGRAVGSFNPDSES